MNKIFIKLFNKILYALHIKFTKKLLNKKMVTCFT